MSPEKVIADKEQFDKTVDKILSSGKYWRFNNRLREETQPLLERFQKWIEKLLNNNIDGIENAAGISKVLSTVFIIVLSICILITLLLLVRHIYQRIQARGKLKEILGEKITKETTPEFFRETASQYEQEGAYRMSIRYTYIALLLLMHEKEILFIKDAMTNTEIYECLQKDGYRQLSLFKTLMEVFNYTWYGQNEYGQQAYNLYKENLSRLWSEVMRYEKSHR